LKQNKDADKPSVGVVKFVVVGWFVIKLGEGGGVLFVAKKNSGRRRNEGREEDGRSPSYKLNITDGINSSIILFIKVTRHCSFWLFLIPSFPTVIPPINTRRRFIIIYRQKNDVGVFICIYHFYSDGWWLEFYIWQREEE